MLRHPASLLALVVAWLGLAAIAPSDSMMDGYTFDQTRLIPFRSHMFDRWLQQRSFTDKCLAMLDDRGKHRIIRYEDLNSWEDQRRVLDDPRGGVFAISFDHSVKIRGFLIPLFENSRIQMVMDLQRTDMYTKEELITRPLRAQAGAEQAYAEFVASRTGLDQSDLAQRLLRGDLQQDRALWWGWAWLAAMLVIPVMFVRGLFDLPRFCEDWAARRRLKREGLCACGYSRAGLAEEVACPECGVAPVARVGQGRAGV